MGQVGQRLRLVDGVRTPRPPASPPPVGGGSYASAEAYVAARRPLAPVHLFRPHVVRCAAQWFLRHFPGTVLYAVKANPSPTVIRALGAGGLRHFDVASAAEVALIAGLKPKARLHFMHPVKAREAIAAAYTRYGVRDYVADSEDEIRKIVQETGGARDLGIVLRLAVANDKALYDLSGKFGADVPEAARLLTLARPLAARVGLAFHVGQQTMDSAAYANALDRVGEVARLAGVVPDIVDVGGGFPVSFPGCVPPPLLGYLDTIRARYESLAFPKTTQLWCEPGRALVQESGSLITRVLLREGDTVYLNEGVHGALFDACTSDLAWPARLIRPDGPPPEPTLRSFTIHGPSGEPEDRWQRTLPLPTDTREGDWLEIGQMGGYGLALRRGAAATETDAPLARVDDAPMLTTPGFWNDEGFDPGAATSGGRGALVAM